MGVFYLGADNSGSVPQIASKAESIDFKGMSHTADHTDSGAGARQDMEFAMQCISSSFQIC